MPDYARRNEAGDWELLQGAFTVKDGGSSIVAIDPENPHAGTHVVTFDVNFPHNWLEHSAPAQRTALGIKPIGAPTAPPAGHRVLETVISDVAGVPKYLHLTEAVQLGQREGELVAAYDAERDRRQQMDFSFDFAALDPELQALDDAGEAIAAGERSLQMRPEDRANWGDLQAQAMLAVMNGAPSALMPMRAEDNWNIQTTAAQVLVVTSAMFARNAELLFFAAGRKSAGRAAIAANDGEALDAIIATVEAGWPV